MTMASFDSGCWAGEQRLEVTRKEFVMSSQPGLSTCDKITTVVDVSTVEFALSAAYNA